MSAKLFVGNLPDDCPKDTLRDLFSPYGDIEDISIVKNYAFVNFTSEDASSKAVQDLDGTKIAGKTINVEVSKKRDKPGPRRDNRDNNRDNRGDNNRDNRNRDRDWGGPRGRRDGPDRSNDRGQGPDRGGVLGKQGLGLGAGLGGLGGILGAVGAAGGLGGLVGQGLGGLGGAPLAAALSGAGGNAPLGGLGILSAVNTLAAVKQQQMNVAQQQQQQQQQQQHQQQQQQQHKEKQPSFQEERPREQPDPDVRVRREVVHTQEVPNASAMGLSNGYVIYERYYVDPSHPLLKGLPLPELPRMSDSRESRDVGRNDNDSYREAYRDRSPMNNNARYQNELRR